MKLRLTLLTILLSLALSARAGNIVIDKSEIAYPGRAITVYAHSATAEYILRCQSVPLVPIAAVFCNTPEPAIYNLQLAPDADHFYAGENVTLTSPDHPSFLKYNYIFWRVK